MLQYVLARMVFAMKQMVLPPPGIIPHTPISINSCRTGILDCLTVIRKPAKRVFMCQVDENVVCPKMTQWLEVFLKRAYIPDTT